MEATEQLILDSQDYVEALARDILKGLPRKVRFEDLVGYGQIGLVEAAGAYDPSRGASFRTFAYRRIRGAIFDGLRKMSGLTAGQRKEIARRSGENAVIEEVAETSAASDDPAFVAAQIERTVKRLGLVHLMTDLSDDDSHAIEARAEEATEEDAERRELLERLREALVDLPPAYAEILRMHYFEDRSLTEIGQKLGKHKSSISRAHSKALESLHSAILPDAARAATPPAV